MILSDKKKNNKSHRGFVKHLLLIVIFVFVFAMPNYTKVLSWSINNMPSLELTDEIGIVYSNNAVMSDTNFQTNFIRIEDIVLSRGYMFTNLFIRFQKNKISSFVRVRVFDAFTDEMVFTRDFYEQDILALTNNQFSVARVYMVVELYGADIELRSVGLGMAEMTIIDDIILNKEKLIATQDSIEITITLNEAANVNLLMYSRIGDVCKSFLVNKVLDAGTYQFFFDPQELNFDYRGDKRYYIWLQANNLRSKPVEILKTIYIIPE